MATGRAFVPTTMPDMEVWYGNVLRADSEIIVIDDEYRRTIYEGQFAYGPFGDVSGALDGVTEIRGGTVIYTLDDIGADAGDMYFAVQILGDFDRAASIVLGGDNIIDGSSGRDNLTVFGGDDLVLAHGGDDTLFGNGGDDTLIGAAGQDRLFGAAGADRLDGGSGADRLVGGSGADRLVGGSGRDALFGGKHADTLLGGRGNDVLIGEDGRDILKGGGEDDRLSGGRGGDRLVGGNGSDTLSGQRGDDVLNGGKGRDHLYGGAGSDEFVFRPKFGDDVIFGFRRASDSLTLDDRLWSGELSARQVVKDFATETRDGVVFEFDGGDSFLIAGLDSADNLAGLLNIV